MTLLGGGTRMPVRMGGGKSKEMGIYDALLAAQGTAYSKDWDALVNKENRAHA